MKRWPSLLCAISALAVILAGLHASQYSWEEYGRSFLPTAYGYLIPAGALLAIAGLLVVVKKPVWIALDATLAVLALMYAFGGVILTYIDFAPVTTPLRYAKIIATLFGPNNPDTAHFPRAIPATAQDVHFYYSPSWQGCFIQLQYRDTPDVIEALYRRFNAEKGYAYTDSLDAAEYSFIGTDNQFTTLSKDFTVMVLKPIPTGEFAYDEPIHGIAISRQRNIIIYWADW